MKKFFIALEEQVEVLEEEIAPELIVEADPEAIDGDNEEVIEAEEKSADIETVISETERVEDVAEALESLCEIISRMDQPTPVNVAMIKLVANMGVAGTSVPAHALFSANEDFSDLKITIEGIQDKIKAVGSTIAKTASTVAGKVMNFIKSVMSAYARYSEKIIAIKNKLAELKKAKTAKSISINIRGNNGLYNDGQPVKDAKEYLSAFKNTNKSMTVFSELFAAQTSKSCGESLSLFTNVVKNKEKSEEEFLKIFKAYDEDFFGKLVKLPGMTPLSNAEIEQQFDTDYEDDSLAYNLSNILGNIKMYVTLPKPNSFDKGNVKEVKKHITDYHLSSVTTAKDDQSQRINILFNDVQISFVEQLISECEKTLQISKNYSSKQFKIAQFCNSAKTTALITAAIAAVGGAGYAAGGYVAGSMAGSSLAPVGSALAGVGAGIGATKVITGALSISANVKLLNNLNYNLSYMSKATWRHSNLMLSTALGICDKILSSKEWTAQAAA